MAYWSAKKTNELLPSITDANQAEKSFDDWWRGFKKVSAELKVATLRLENPMAAKIQKAVLQPLDWEGPPRTDLPPGSYPENPESSFMFRKIVFLKFGVTFRELVYQIDIQRSDAAYRKLMAAHRDYWGLLRGVPLRGLKLKFSSDHFDIVTHGFDFGFDALTATELSDCLDEICPCSKKHSPEYLKKLRTRIKRVSRQLTMQEQFSD